MYYSKDSKTNSADQEALQTSLMESLRINSIKNIPNSKRSVRTNLKWDAMYQCNKNLVENGKNAARKPYKGKLSKSSLKTIKQDIETKEKELQSKREIANKKSNTLAFIERLKHIEKSTDNCNFLEQANEEIDVAAKQLEEIRKLFANNLAIKQSNSEIKNPKKKNDQYHRYSCNKRDNKQLQRLQDQYLKKTKIYYKSLQNFEQTSWRNHEKKPPIVNYSYNNVKSKVNSCPRNNPVIKSRTNPLVEKSLRVTSSECQTDDNPHKLSSHSLKNKKSVSFNREKFDICLPNAANKARPFSSEFLDKRKYSCLQRRLQTILSEESEPEVVTDDENSSSDVEICEDINNIFFSNTFKSKKEEDEEVCYTSRENLVDCKISQDTVDDEVVNPDPKESLLNGICTELDVMLQESVLKSAYLSKEFSADFTNKFLGVDKEEKKSTQLLGTTQRKFPQTFQLTNLPRRDQKLYTTLNIALKNTLYGQVQQ